MLLSIIIFNWSLNWSGHDLYRLCILNLVQVDVWVLYFFLVNILVAQPGHSSHPMFCKVACVMEYSRSWWYSSPWFSRVS